MDDSVAGVYLPDRRTRWSRPLIMCRVPAGFPSPAEDYVEGRIDLNRDLIKHPLSTFYIRVSGDSMVGAGILPGALLVVDRAVEAHDGHVVVARIGDELCVKRLSLSDEGSIRLLSENETYPPIEITEGMDFEVWGRVVYSILGH
jgi:DNA polymerase V